MYGIEKIKKNEQTNENMGKSMKEQVRERERRGKREGGREEGDRNKEGRKKEGRGKREKNHFSFAAENKKTINSIESPCKITLDNFEFIKN